MGRRPHDGIAAWPRRSRPFFVGEIRAMQGAPPASHTGHGSEVGRGCAAGPAEGDWAASSPRCTTAWNAPVYSGLYTSLTPISPLALHCRPLCSRLRARRCGKASRQSLRADLGPKGSVGGQGSPPRSVHEAIQVSPHFYDHLKEWSEGASGGLHRQRAGAAMAGSQGTANPWVLGRLQVRSIG